MKFRKKPIVIEAVQLRWDTWNEIGEVLGFGVGGLKEGNPEGCYLDPEGKPTGDGKPYGTGEPRMGLLIPTLEGLMIATQNDWIIRGVKNELYPCKPDIFEATYEAVDEHPGVVNRYEDANPHWPLGKNG